MASHKWEFSHIASHKWEFSHIASHKWEFSHIESHKWEFSHMASHKWEFNPAKIWQLRNTVKGSTWIWFLEKSVKISQCVKDVTLILSYLTLSYLKTFWLKPWENRRLWHYLQQERVREKTLCYNFNIHFFRNI